MAQMSIDESALRNGGYLADPWKALDLDTPGLEAARELHAAGHDEQAAERVLDYYRRSALLFPGGAPSEERFVERLRGEPAFQPMLSAQMREADETRELIFWVGRTRTRPELSMRWESADAIDWSYAPGGTDLEWTYSLNRHTFWVSLARAWRLTGDDRYIAAYCDQADAWMRRCPRPLDYARATHTPVGETWRSIEVGIRGGSWLNAMSLARFSPAMRPATWLRLLASLAEHAEFLAGFYPPYARQGNWGVLQTQGLLHIALLLPELRGAARWRELGLARMDDMAQRQIGADGYHWEYTPGYHRVVTNLYTGIYGLCAHVGLSAPAFLPALRRALSAHLALMQPDHHFPMLSDTDSQNSDMRDDFTGAAYFLRSPELKAAGRDQFNYEMLWLWGLAAAERYAALPASETLTEPMSRYLPQAGFAAMRSDWSEQARLLVLVGSPVDAGHRHDDIGHVELHAYGRHFLSDPSFHSYIESDPLRRRLKESPAHTTFTVDGESASIYVDTAHWIPARALDAFWRSDTLFDYAQIAHTGYLRLAAPVLVTRRALYLKSDGGVPDYWLLADQAETSAEAEHRYQQRFGYAPEIGRVEVDAAARRIATVESAEAGAATLSLVAVEETARARLEDGVASPVAFSTVPTTVGVFEYQTRGPLFAPVALVPAPAGGPAPAPDISALDAYTLDGALIPTATARALAFDFGDGRRDLVIFQLRGAGPAQVEDTLFFGEIGLLRQRPGLTRDWIRIK